MTPDAVALDYWLKPLPPDSMPHVAAGLLTDGYDSPALREVAGMVTTDPVAVRETFVQALRDLGTYIATRRDAELRVVRSMCEAAVMGQLSLAALAVKVRALWDFDEVTHDGLPPAESDLVLMCWLFGEDTYESNGGDDRLNRAIALIASQ